MSDQSERHLDACFVHSETPKTEQRRQANVWWEGKSSLAFCLDMTFCLPYGWE